MSIRDITLGRYLYGESILHRLDPRAKLVSSLAVMTGIFAGGGFYALAVAAAFTLLCVAISGIPAGTFARSILPFKWLIILTVALNVLFTGGIILFEAPLPYGGVTREGLSLGILYGTRIAVLVAAASLLTLTTEPVALVDGIEKMLRPLARFGLRPHDIATAMIITIRFVPVLMDEAVKIRKSCAARGFRPLRLRGGLRFVSLLLVPLLTGAIRRAEDLALAMDCRLYRVGAERTRYRELRMEKKDWAAILMTALVVASMFVTG